MNKYHSRKITKDGEVFDSIKEYQRWCELKLLERAGKIKDLKRQVKFVLIPAQYETVWNDKKMKYENGKCMERECAYIADFVYIDMATGFETVEDTKGYKKGNAYALFVVKRKLCLWRYGIRIQEV